MPAYINTLQPQDCRLLGLTVSAGLIIGLYTTGFTLAQTVAVVALARTGDRFDKRTVLLVVVRFGAGVDALFRLVDSSVWFITVRTVRGVAVTGAGLLTLVCHLATVSTRVERDVRAHGHRCVSRTPDRDTPETGAVCLVSPENLGVVLGSSVWLPENAVPRSVARPG